MIEIDPIPLADAVAKLNKKTPIYRALTSAQWEEVPLALRERAFFSARVAEADVLDKMHGLLKTRIELGSTAVANGERLVDRSSFIRDIRKHLADSGYVVDPKDAGTIKDLTSRGRLGLIFDMNTQMAQGYARWLAGQAEGALAAFPAQELYREEDRQMPRDWQKRWADAGGETFAGRYIARKNDPIWIRISRFETPYPPFDFRSGMSVRDVSREDAIALGVMQPGETQVRPDVGFNDRLQTSVKDMAPEIRTKLESKLPGLVDDGAGVLKWSSQFHDPYVATDFGRAGRVTDAAKDAASAVAEVHQISARKLTTVTDRLEEVGTHLGEYVLGVQKINVRPAAAQPRLAFLHEFGHGVDEALGGSAGKYATAGASKDVWPVLRALRSTVSYREIDRAARVSGPLQEWCRYAAQPDEVFARGYAQYIATKTGRDSLLAELEALQAKPFLGGHWEAEEFLTVVRAFDELFALRGWTL